MSDGPQYGANNPHPLSQVKTELIWEGKYDEYGNRREVDIAGCDTSILLEVAGAGGLRSQNATSRQRSGK